MRVARESLKELFTTCLGIAFVALIFTLIHFHKPWWEILLYVLAVLLLVGIAQFVIEKIKWERETTVIGVGGEMILNGLRTEDEFEKFIKALREYVDLSRKVKHWREVPWHKILTGEVEYSWRKESKAKHDYRNATASFNETLGRISERTSIDPKGKAFPTLWTKLLAGLLNACGFRTYRKRILLSAFKECFDKYILDDKTTAEDINELITAWREDWHYRKVFRVGSESSSWSNSES